ncbi:MAG: outer membrane lipoprotein-sorting protein [Bacteroidota bacterium]
MKTLKTGAFILLAGLSLGSVKAQTVDEVVGKYVDALGGKSVLSSIKSIYVESTIDLMGNEAPCTTYILNGKGYKNELDFNGTKIIQCITDKGGWALNPMAGSSTPTAIPEDQVKASQAQLQVGGPLFDYAAKGNKVELIGKDTSGGAAAFKLKLTSGSVDITYFIDATTYHINKVVSKFSVNGQDIESTAYFSDYKKTDFGYTMAFTQKVELPQITLNITNKKVEVNKAIDPAIFDMPK